MEDRVLKQLLQKADGDYATCAADENFAQRIIAIDRRRMQVRRTATGILAIFLIGVMATTLLIHQKPSTPVVAAPLRDATNELAALEIDAAVHEQVADRILRDEKTAAQHPPRPQPPDVLAAIALERERAAMLLINQGDWQTPRDQAAARQEYRRARDLFPDTFAANIAKDRLEKLVTRKDRSI